MRRFIFVAGLLLPIASACADRSSAGPSSAASELVRCRLPGGLRALCGTLEVPQSRDEAEGPTLSLGFAVVRSEAEDKQEPVVLLAGGPGQSAIQAFAPALKSYAPFLRERDVLLLDQRGTGKSNPLACDASEDALDLADSLSIDVDVERLVACRQKYADVDLGAYATPNAVEDLNAVLDRVQFEEVNLVGISYGTRMATAFARRHPERVHAMVLDAVAPVDMAMPLSFGPDADQSIDRMLDDCGADPTCRDAFGDLREVLTSALQEIPEGGTKVTVAHPRTGEPTEVEVDRDLVLQGLRSVLYVPEIASLLPLSIARAADGDLGPLMAQFLLLSDGLQKGLADGMFLSVMCAEDVPFITAEDMASAAESSRFGTTIVDGLQSSCEQWVRGPLPADYREPVAADVPTLLLSGELDPVTPPRWAAHAAETLANARTVTVPGAGHGTLGIPCVPDVVDVFLDDIDPANLDVSCTEDHRRPAFFIDFAGPTLEAP